MCDEDGGAIGMVHYARLDQAPLGRVELAGVAFDQALDQAQYQALDQALDQAEDQFE